MSYMPTAQQARALDVIKTAITVNGQSPTMQEVAEGLGLSSHASARRLVVELIAKGLVKQLPGRRRSLSLVAPCECPHCGAKLP